MVAKKEGGVNETGTPPRDPSRNTGGASCAGNTLHIRFDCNHATLTDMNSSAMLPVSRSEMKQRGWDELDVILVTADAYCDHPSFGAALLGRLLEDEGYRVGVIAQPDWKKDADFTALGRPRLFFGITAGNLDSMLNIYTSNRNLRKTDKYSPGARTGRRPRFPTIVYSNKVRELFKGSPVVIGGIEASMRRLAHYDFWSDHVKRSIVFDAKADMLVYGMAERQVMEISKRLRDGEPIGTMDNIRGTVVARSDGAAGDAIHLPSFEEVERDKNKFLDAFRLYSRELNPYTAHTVVQKTGGRFCIQFPPALPLSEAEMDRLYDLPFTRRWHPMYDREGGIPALEPVETSITSHRGCAANCSFCSLSFHQGRVVQSRSRNSIVQEAERIARRKGFKGVISDVGGPTANMYRASCRIKHRCDREDCLWPDICEHFRIDHEKAVEMLGAVRAVRGVKHVNIQSGVRYDLLIAPQAQKYFRQLCEHHVSGQLKIAPEHVADDVLALMRKPSVAVYRKFVEAYRKMNEVLGKKQFLAQYFITAHPGCGPQQAKELALFTKTLGYTPEQVQDFLPLPMTRSGCMYHTGIDPDTGKSIHVPKGKFERSKQRAWVQG